MSSSRDPLWESFVAPPASARPRVWWHWMNGNVDEAGITLDLEWMKRIGLGGAQAFEGGMNTPQLVPERIVFGSPQWKSAMRTAANLAEELELELTVATSAGWSAAGAPWVEPADAMKKLVWSEQLVEGRVDDLMLPGLPEVAGRYQDIPRWGAPAADPRLGSDVITVAIPAGGRLLVPDAATSSSGTVAIGALVDGSFATGIELPRDLTSPSTAWIAVEFETPVEVRSVTLGLPGPRGFGSPPPVHAIVESSDDGEGWIPVVELPAGQAPVRSRSFLPRTARFFRARFEGEPAERSIPPMDPGVLPLPFPPAAPFTHVTQFALWTGGRVSAAEEKAGFGTVLDYYALDGPDEPGVDPADVVDLAEFVSEGRLTWDAPPGLWRVIRFGYSLTGHQNGPAPLEATGLEIDKLDAQRVEAYLTRWLGQFRDAVGSELMGERGIRSLLSDSIESGPQNWTESLPRAFEERRGYSLAAWMPVLAGYIVQDSAATDRVLWDFRQTIAELYSEGYYATVARIAHEWGLGYYAEALEDHRPQLGDDMTMRSHADVPMGAMWTFDPTSGAAATYVADIRGASSVAHVYGKQFTGAESLSAFGHPYTYTPRDLKPIADLELALGVTRFCIHTSPHQPSSVRAPGISLTPHLGQTFTRHETWAEVAGPWITYLARSSHLLNLGAPVVDVAFFYGEEGPLTAVYGDHEPSDVPAGFAWDFVSPDAVRTALSASPDGTLESRGGARYRVLYLGGRSDRMTLGTLRVIARLVRAGATVVGTPPSASPSAADDPVVFAEDVAELWSQPRVVVGDLESALGAPDWIAPGLDVVHRALPDGDIYFLRNPAPQRVEVEVSLRAEAEGAEWWDAVAGTRVAARAARRDGRTLVEVTLSAFESGFLVLRSARNTSLVLSSDELLVLEGLHTDQEDEPGFSGTATWSTELLVEPAWLADAQVILRLDEVHDLAEVVVNGRSAGVAWTAPFEVEVSAVLQPGMNRIEIRVTNAWANRLIADAAHPESATTQTTMPIYSPTAPPRPWGLRGPVTLVRRPLTMGSSAYL